MCAARNRCLAAMIAGLIVLAFTRIRALLPLYVDFHRWLDRQGVPSEVRNLDGSLLLVLVAIIAASLAARTNALRAIGLLGARTQRLPAALRQGLLVGIIASIPMLAQAAFVSSGTTYNWDTAKGTLIAPFVEEVFFRGLLVALPVAVGGFRFWPTAIVSSLLFGALHVPWNGQLNGNHIWPFLITGCGGLWYAWLLRVYAWNLWTTIVLHSGMNAAWLVFAVAGGATGDGLWSNLGRATTIALGTVIALRHRRSPVVDDVEALRRSQ